MIDAYHFVPIRLNASLVNVPIECLMSNAIIDKMLDEMMTPIQQMLFWE